MSSGIINNCITIFILIFLADENKDENMCSYYDDDDCRYTYVYYYDANGKEKVRAQEERECPPQVRFMGKYKNF